MATAVSAVAATAGVRGGVGLCSCAITMTTAVSGGTATAEVTGDIGLCSFVITLVTKAAASLGIHILWSMTTDLPS